MIFLFAILFLIYKEDRHVALTAQRRKQRREDNYGKTTNGAEALWQRLICGESRVVPNRIAYGARIKAHVLCGRPTMASEIMDEALRSGCELNPVLGQSHVQALIIVCHSSLAQRDFRRLDEALERGEPVLREGSPKQKRTWLALRDVAAKILSAPASVELHDALVEDNARQSDMAKWSDCSAGPRYQ